jgi:hypothetical protein
MATTQAKQACKTEQAKPAKIEAVIIIVVRVVINLDGSRRSRGSCILRINSDRAD